MPSGKYLGIKGALFLGFGVDHSQDLLHGDEARVWADSAYTGQGDPENV